MLVLVLTLMAGGAVRADYPERPVRLVVGYAAGGTTDVIARFVAKGLTQELGQTFIVENKPGANSNIGTAQVANAAPDGYTLLLGTISNTTNASLYKSLSFDVLRDFEPVGSIGIVPNVLVVPATSPIKSYQDYVAFVQQNPGKMTFASAGTGSSIHLSGELFKSRLKLDMLHVPYKGSGPAVTDLIAGQVGSMFDNLPSSMPHIQSGKLRALAVTSPQRVASLPDVPTVAESGLPGFEAYSWTGIMAPAGTPQAVVAKLNGALKKLLADPALDQQFQGLGATPRVSDPQEFGRFFEAEVKKWAVVVRESGVAVE
ncbi:Bug family tripartite tricarboxylate transporter substrate binding protein [Achromobacter denitrificans]